MKNWNINPESIVQFVTNGWVFWKDTKGCYLGCNDIMGNDLNIPTKEIVGSYDLQFPLLKCEAEYYRSEDELVIKQGVPLQFTDTATLSQKKFNFLVLKMPIIATKKIIGIFGISYYMNQDHTSTKTNSTIIHSSSISLSLKEQIISSFLIRGKTAKEIGVLVNLSSRTVEHYIERIKYKLKVKTKSQLIDLLFEILK